jgi:dTDP-glucose 4,6-dehydratase
VPTVNTILVTGGAGFIGSCLVRHLVVDGKGRVVTFDKRTDAGRMRALSAVSDNPSHCFVRGDICDGAAVAAVLEEYRPMAVYHLAAESLVEPSNDGALRFVDTNVRGTATLLDAVRSYWERLPVGERESFRFLHVSADDVYGYSGSCAVLSEATPYAPNSPYSASKAASDHFVRAYFHTYGLPTLVTNCSNNYGPFQPPEKLIPRMIVSALEGKSLTVDGQGQNVRDWLYVEDHCRALEVVRERGQPGQVYHVGGGCQRTDLEVVEAICDMVDELRPGLPHSPCRSLIQLVSDDCGHGCRHVIDTSKIERELGWRAQRDFQSGMRLTVSWNLEHPEWACCASVKHRRNGSSGKGHPGCNAAGARTTETAHDDEYVARERRRIHEFQNRDYQINTARYAVWQPAEVFARHERRRVAAAMLRKAGVFPEPGDRCLEVGHGCLGWLGDLMSWGVREIDLHGIELDEARCKRAQRVFPLADLRVGDATEMPWEDGAFDLVIASTVFTSILDERVRRLLAREIARVLAPQGVLLCYDFAVNNPRNRNTRRLGRRELRVLFPELTGQIRSIALAAPLARWATGRSWVLATLLEAIPVLRTHLMAVLKKGSQECEREPGTV